MLLIGERDLARHRSHQRIADGARLGVMGFALAGAQRARMIVKALRLGGHQLRLRIARLDSGGDACDQPAAGGRRHHDIRRDAERGQILSDLAARRALARDHKGSS